RAVRRPRDARGIQALGPPASGHGLGPVRPRFAPGRSGRRRRGPLPGDGRPGRLPSRGAELRQMGPPDPPRPMTSGGASMPLRCWAEIDLAALERNLRLIRASLPAHIRYVAVVKADAYGHGLQQVAGRLMHAGADLFAVANITEAAQVRELGPGWPILVLGPLLPDEDRYVAEYDLAVTVSTEDEVSRFDAAGRAAGRPIPVHLKVDTGMGRLGVWHEEAPRMIRRIRGSAHLKLVGVFTHFASPDTDPQFTEEQRRRFLAALDACGPAGLPMGGLLVHADNSAGLETMHGRSPFNAVRIGLLQFGILPHPGSF